MAMASCMSRSPDNVHAVLDDAGVFETALKNYVCRTEHALPLGQRLGGLLQLLEIVVRALADTGQKYLHEVLVCVQKQVSVHVTVVHGWRSCHISGLPSRSCLQIGDFVVVHEQYAKFVQCLWLVTHVHEVEAARGCGDIPRPHAGAYRDCFRFVFAQLEEMAALTPTALWR